MKIRCPWCQTTNNRSEALLGQLGHLSHYRCRYCGGDFSREGR
jgi:transposase-like protein